MKKLNKIIFWTFVIAILAIIVINPFDLMARPGGGQSYSSGGGGGFDSGGGDGIGIIIWLLFNLLPPYISIPLIIIILIVYAIYKKKNPDTQVVSNQTYQNRNTYAVNTEEQISKLKMSDKNFSRVLFIDFVTSLYVKFQHYRFDIKQLTTIKPFLSDALLQNYKNNFIGQVSEVAIGSIDISRIDSIAQKIQITVEISANYTISTANGANRFIVTDRWILERNSGVLSHAPEKMQSVSCPSCGAPANFNDAGICSYCGTTVVPGTMQWYVANGVNTSSQVISTNALLSYAPEVGTDYPTIYSPTINNAIQQFSAQHKTDFNQYWSKFYYDIASKYFMEIYKNWSDLTWDKVRHLLTDRLWESYNFWIINYKQAKLRNVLEDVKIQKMHLAKIETDLFYEAFTVRIFASTKDYVADENGKVKVGSKTAPRYFSEYWTFIRRQGVENDNYDMIHCPNCGAPLDKMGQNGICGYCNTKVTTGQFSWVLAIITQDEEYKG